ncbi:hypothetical protein BA190_25895 [Labrys sp. WJW]|nr:hypothetical protein BA190_25895 [Labrys sp. WJW]
MELGKGEGQLDLDNKRAQRQPNGMLGSRGAAIVTTSPFAAYGLGTSALEPRFMSQECFLNG